MFRGKNGKWKVRKSPTNRPSNPKPKPKPKSKRVNPLKTLKPQRTSQVQSVIQSSTFLKGKLLEYKRQDSTSSAAAEECCEAKVFVAQYGTLCRDFMERCLLLYRKTMIQCQTDIILNSTLIRLLNHERTGRISLIGRSFRVRMTEQETGGSRGKHTVLPGMHETLRKLFYNPKTNMDTRKTVCRAAGYRVQSTVYDHNRKRPRMCTHAGMGVPHGKKVHEQLETFVQQVLSVSSDSSDSVVGTKDKALLTRWFNRVSKKGEGLSERVDECVLDLLRCFIEKKEWLPVAAEYPVWDEYLHLASSIDLVMVDKPNGRLITVELKTGYEDQCYGPLPNGKDWKMQGPMSELSDCPMNRHMLQLAMCNLILRKRYGVQVGASYVIRICPRSKVISSVEVPQWKHSMEQCYSYVHLNQSKNRTTIF